MKAIRFVALLLVLVTVLPLAVSAYGKDDSTLLITHINTSPSTEGSAIILSGSSVKKLGEKGSDEFFENLDQMIGKLKKAGLGALECYHPSADHDQSLRLVKLAEKYKLHITQGSDYHGPEF
jgi:hypothetical protein